MFHTLARCQSDLSGQLIRSGPGFGIHTHIDLTGVILFNSDAQILQSLAGRAGHTLCYLDGEPTCDFCR